MVPGFAKVDSETGVSGCAGREGLETYIALFLVVKLSMKGEACLQKFRISRISEAFEVYGV